jgi:hypothetical protein
MSFSLTGNEVAGIIASVKGYKEPMADTIRGAQKTTGTKAGDRLLNQSRALDPAAS